MQKALFVLMVSDQTGHHPMGAQTGLMRILPCKLSTTYARLRCGAH